MGYSSTVYIKVYEQEYNELIEFMKTLRYLEPDSIYDCGMIDNKKVYTMYWDWIKWDPYYPDIESMEDKLLDYYDNNTPFHFLRIGEDDGDIESYGVGNGLESILNKSGNIDGIIIS